MMNKIFAKEYVESQDDRLVIASHTIARRLLNRLAGAAIFPLVVSGGLFYSAFATSNTGHSVTLTCDRIEDYVNCAYRQVKIDGTVILEESIPRATYTTVNVAHGQSSCDEDGDCTEITTCNLFIVGRNGSLPIPFETFDPSDYNCTQENQLVLEITRLIQGESKVSLFRVQDNGFGDLWLIAWDWVRNIWLGFFLLMGLTNFGVKQDIWTFDRKKQCFTSERKRLWGSKIEEIALDDLTGIYGAYPDIALSIKEGDNLQAKTISNAFHQSKIFELITPWLNPHYRVLKILKRGYFSLEITPNQVLTILKRGCFSLEITPNQLRFLERKVVKFLILKDIGCFKLWDWIWMRHTPKVSESFLEGKTQDIQSIVIRRRPNSDGEVFKQLCIQTIAGEIHPFSLSAYYLGSDSDYEPIAQAIADYINVEVTIVETES